MNKLSEYKLDGFAQDIFRDRYAINEKETFSEACWRISDTVSQAEIEKNKQKYLKRFFDLLLTNRFCPAGRIWSGCGRPRGNLNNCYVLPKDNMDSREGWGETIKNTLVISGTGGGVGINFSMVRPRGSEIKGTGGQATGSVSLMKMVNGVCEELRAGGGRRSALIFCLDYDHPDIEEFLSVKLNKKQLTNANISVLINKQFISLVKENKNIDLKWQGKFIKKISAKDFWNVLVENALESGDPGLLNLEYANEMSPISYRYDLVGVNPCSEQVLPAFGVCCLGSIVLSKHVINNKFNWDMLAETITLGIRFLDNIIDVTHYPLKEIEQISKNERRIGLGIMGFHDMLIMLGIKYSSTEALVFADKLMNFIKKKSYEANTYLSNEKGQFPLMDIEKHLQTGFIKTLSPSIKHRIREYGLRNCCILNSAPTGTTSILSDCSSGIEPMFAPVYERRYNKHKDSNSDMKNRSKRIVIHPLLKRFIKEKRDISVFEGAHEISPEQHIKMQQVFQKHLDGAISKTINISSDGFDKNKLSKLLLDNISTLKGITIYRDGSKGDSPLMPIPLKEAEKYFSKIEKIETKNVINDCPKGQCDL